MESSILNAIKNNLPSPETVISTISNVTNSTVNFFNGANPVNQNREDNHNSQVGQWLAIGGGLVALASMIVFATYKKTYPEKDCCESCWGCLGDCGDQLDHSSVVNGRLQVTENYQRREEGYYIEDESPQRTRSWSELERIKEEGEANQKRERREKKDAEYSRKMNVIKNWLHGRKSFDESIFNSRTLNLNEKEFLKAFPEITKKDIQEYYRTRDQYESNTQTPNFSINTNQFANYNSISQ